jgi:hypothetical protein
VSVFLLFYYSFLLIQFLFLTAESSPDETRLVKRGRGESSRRNNNVEPRYSEAFTHSRTYSGPEDYEEGEEVSSSGNQNYHNGMVVYPFPEGQRRPRVNRNGQSRRVRGEENQQRTSHEMMIDQHQQQQPIHDSDMEDVNVPFPVLSTGNVNGYLRYGTGQRQSTDVPQDGIAGHYQGSSPPQVIYRWNSPHPGSYSQNQAVNTAPVNRTLLVANRWARSRSIPQPGQTTQTPHNSSEDEEDEE